MSYRYTAHTSSNLRKYCFADEIEIPSIADAQDGFWINKYGGFTRNEEECLMWIPPAQILYVKRTANDKDQQINRQEQSTY